MGRVRYGIIQLHQSVNILSLHHTRSVLITVTPAGRCEKIIFLIFYHAIQTVVFYLWMKKL